MISQNANSNFFNYQTFNLTQFNSILKDHFTSKKKDYIMNFIDSLQNTAYTDNGALAYKSTDSAVLDLFSSGVSSQDKKQLIINALQEDTKLALKTILYLRDVRNGQGNRDILRDFFKSINMSQSDNFPIIKEVISHLPEIGRWKDVIELIGTNSKFDLHIISMIKQGLADKDALLAKWLPRQGSVAKYIAHSLKLNHGEYRRLIVSLSSTVEQQICKNQWSEVNYAHVPSLANKKYAKAFMKHDMHRRDEFLDSILSDKSDTKMNSSALYPHQIVQMINMSPWQSSQKNNKAADALWKSLPNYMTKAKNVLPVIDVSGSMWTKATGTNGQCIDIAIGLGLYFAEHNTGSYKDVWVNFSSTPSVQKLKGSTLSERIKNLNYNNWRMNTDIDAVLSLVLNKSKTNPEDTPEMILIVSDMEFDSCIRSNNTNFENIKEQYKELNIEMPTILFWRVNVSSGSTPVMRDDKNAILINGYSPIVLKSILSGDIKNYTPEKAMHQVLDPMYSWLDELFIKI